MVSFRETFITFSIISLFVFALISFVDIFQQENNDSNSILENEKINSTFVSLRGNISTGQVSVNTSEFAFNEDVPTPGFGSLIVFAIVGVTQGFMSIITTTFNLIIVLPITTLGVPGKIANILGSILIVSLILLAWRVYRVGS